MINNITLINYEFSRIYGKVLSRNIITLMPYMQMSPVKKNYPIFFLTDLIEGSRFKMRISYLYVSLNYIIKE